jgi:hypothetical protein
MPLPNHGSRCAAARGGIGHDDDQSPYIYLSDGGHFENMGLFEMVLRRCRLIIATDGGADPDYKFEDLGNAVRKIASTSAYRSISSTSRFTSARRA